MENSLLSFVDITEKTALACYPLIGYGDSKGADQLAVSAMRTAFNKLPVDIQIVIGEGERDQAPRLYTGERLGDQKSSVKLDIAVDPLEGTALCAEARPGALSVMAVAQRGELFKAPDIYMKKLACGSEARGAIDLQAPVKDNILRAAKALGKQPEDMTVGVLDRPRHKQLIQEIRETKARIKLVGDGDVALSLETALDFYSLDLLMGTGGAPEGVLSAVALKCLNGGFQAQLVYKDEQERQRAEKAGVQKLDKIWDRDELVRSSACFFATGVTTGPFLEGVKKEEDICQTHSLILTPNSQREIKRKHFLKTV
ncbi:MAG: class II fructose-bisphosphatase [Oligoflexia bacterium]|nr:class II fructose-bisphosphatase [Oligoflexia bacterium]